jgi:hypothetical protein
MHGVKIVKLNSEFFPYLVEVAIHTHSSSFGGLSDYIVTGGVVCEVTSVLFRVLLRRY